MSLEDTLFGKSGEDTGEKYSKWAKEQAEKFVYPSEVMYPLYAQEARLLYGPRITKAIAKMRVPQELLSQYRTALENVAGRMSRMGLSQSGIAEAVAADLNRQAAEQISDYRNKLNQMALEAKLQQAQGVKDLAALAAQTGLGGIGAGTAPGMDYARLLAEQRAGAEQGLGELAGLGFGTLIAKYL